MVPVRIESERLVLREFVQDDWPAVHRYASDSEVVRYDAWGPNTEDQTHDFIFRAIALQSQKPRECYQLAVTLRLKEPTVDEVIGACRMGVKPGPDRDADIGYVLRRDLWGQGFGTEMARRLCQFGFEELKLHRIWATCDVRNLGSARVLEKAGFSREGLLRKNKLQRGLWRDSLLYAILEHELA